MQRSEYASVAHCVISLIHHNADWSNDKIAAEASRIMGSETKKGNVSWYKSKLKNGTYKAQDYIGLPAKIEEPVREREQPAPVAPERELHEIEKMTPDPDVMTTRMKPNGVQYLALEFVKARTESTFAALYNRLKPGLTYYAMNLVKDADVAEDVVSVSFTKMWTKVWQYNPHWNFSTWAYKIVYHEAMQHLEKAKKNVSMDKMGNNGETEHAEMHSAAPWLINHGADSESIITTEDPFADNSDDLQNVVYEKVLTQIQDLSGFYKEIIIDREVHGLKYEQIALKYDMHINTVKTRIKRARTSIVENNPEYKKIVDKRNEKRRKENEEKRKARKLKRLEMRAQAQNLTGGTDI